MIKKIFFIILITAGFSEYSACTTAVISGACTIDGRPLLLKHRDTDASQNRVVFIDLGEFRIFGIVNSVDTAGREIWAGMNNFGFAIMNSASYNLNIGDTNKLKDQEGVLMRIALGKCKTLSDFEELLENLPKPLGVEANFGVIDAQGGAAYYETGQYEFTKYDVNDKSVAPAGYLIRTNYSFSRDTQLGYGYIRFDQAEEIIRPAAESKTLDPQFLLENVSRSLKHSLTKTDLRTINTEETGSGFVAFEDFIPRNSSASVSVIRGVAGIEDISALMLWTIAGYPLCAPAVPVFFNPWGIMPAAISAADDRNAPICKISLELKEQLFPVTRGSGWKYLYLPALLNSGQVGILDKVLRTEQEIFSMTDDFSKRTNGNPDKKDLEKFCKEMDSFLGERIYTDFRLKLFD